MKKSSLLSILAIFVATNIYCQITHDETVTIQPSTYGPKLILNDVNTANKVPIEFRSNNIVKWELGTRNASEQYDLALWRFYQGSYSPVMWFNQDNGNIGVGTDNPNSKLEIESLGAHYTSNASLYVKDLTNRGTIILESVLDQPTDFVLKNNNRFSWVMSTRTSSDNYALRFYPSQNGTSWLSPVLSLETDGNVGIGTTSPDSKLTVKGDIHAEEVKVDLSVPGPDYVFKKDYDLKPLEEVQNYIKAHGHLPNIPSAPEMEKNGIQLGEMNMKLLEKIEELTLYVIELKKENELIKKLISVKNEN
nr:tail fiber protein [uncultured Allomuricauda sp.]